MAINLTLRPTKVAAIKAVADGLDGSPSGGQITAAQDLLNELADSLDALGEPLESLCHYSGGFAVAPENDPLEFETVKTPDNIEDVIATAFNAAYAPSA